MRQLCFIVSLLVLLSLSGKLKTIDNQLKFHLIYQAAIYCIWHEFWNSFFLSLVKYELASTVVFGWMLCLLKILFLWKEIYYGKWNSCMQNLRKSNGGLRSPVWSDGNKRRICLWPLRPGTQRSQTYLQTKTATYQFCLYFLRTCGGAAQTALQSKRYCSHGKARSSNENNLKKIVKLIQCLRDKRRLYLELPFVTSDSHIFPKKVALFQPDQTLQPFPIKYLQFRSLHAIKCIYRISLEVLIKTNLSLTWFRR